MPKKSADQSTTCHLLDLPPEIRNAIYDLVFLPNIAEPVELLEATPPSKALALTCRQMHEEAKLLYREAYQKFWEEAEFVLILHPPHGRYDWLGKRRYCAYFSSIRKRLQGMGEHCQLEIGSITRFCIRSIGFDGEWVFRDKIWLMGWPREEPTYMMLPAAYSNALERKGYGLLYMADESILRIYLNVASEPRPDLEWTKNLASGRRISIQEILDVLRVVQSMPL